MKRIAISIVINMLIISQFIGQNEKYRYTENGITFKVSDVEPTNKIIDEISYQKALEYRLGTNLESFQP